jgi:WD40 repeat protein
VTPEQYERVRELFLAVHELDADQRAEYLRAHGADEAVRCEVDLLLASAPAAEAFLEMPVLGADFVMPGPESVPTGAGARIEAGGPAASPGAASVQLPHPERIGQYRILDVLGQGGMGVVYRAEQERPRRIVALKVIRPGQESREALRRFEHEGQVLAWLRHPGIAQVHEVGTADAGHGPQPFFAMELVEGRPLTLYATANRLGVRERLDLLAKVCDAVQHAHQKGVIHRDLKPGNILVDDSGQPKILDFGVARVTDADVRVTTLRTTAGQLVGTLAYMSPEQVAGDPRALDTRSDVYSLGVLCYELLAGHLPLDISARTVPHAARAIVEEEPRPLSSFDRIFRGDVTTIVAKALEKDKERRYQSASDLAADIRRHLADEPVLAQPATTLYRFRKFARRNKPLVFGVAVAFVALLVGILGTTSQAILATRERNRARDAEGRAREQRQIAEQRAYAATIAAAHAALSMNDVATARPLLVAAAPELRNWEWQYLMARLDTSRQTFDAHRDKVWGVAFHPQQPWLASASHDGTVCIWDLDTGAVRHTFATDAKTLRCVAFHPDGHGVVAGAQNGRLLRWDLDTRTALPPLKGHERALDDVVFSADGRRCVTASIDNRAIVWNVETGEPEHVLSHPDWVYAVSLTADGCQLATSCRDQHIRIWDSGSGAQLADIPLPHAPAAAILHSWPVAYDPSGAELAAGGPDGIIYLFDARTHELLQELHGHTARVRSLAFHPRQPILASTSDDITVRLWDVARGRLLATLLGHAMSALGVAFAGDGYHLASASDDHTVRVWDLRAESIPISVGTLPNRALRTARFMPDGVTLVTGGEDNAVRLWDAAAGLGLRTLRGHRGFVLSVDSSLDGTRVASGGTDRVVILWDAGSGQLLETLNGHTAPVHGVRFSPDGTRLYSASGDGTLRVWDPHDGSLVRILVEQSDPLTALDISPDGTLLLVGLGDGRVELRAAADGHPLYARAAHDSAVSHVTFSRDGVLALSASHDGTIVIWETGALTPRATLRGHEDVVTMATFSPDGSRIASVSYDRTLRLWDVSTALCMLVLRAHDDYAWTALFSPDGKRLVSTDRHVRIWDAGTPSDALIESRYARSAAEQWLDKLHAQGLGGADAQRAIAAADDLDPAQRRAARQLASFRGLILEAADRRPDSAP